MMRSMTEVIRIVPERAKILREQFYKSQQALADAWHSRYGNAPHQTQLSAIERGTKGLSLERLRQLAELLETNTDYLLGMSDDDAPSSDLEDQVVFSVRDSEEKKRLTLIGKEFLGLEDKDKQLVLELIERLSNNKPRMID